MSALQAYVRATAPRGRDVERIGPFLATCSRTTGHPMLNYAIPDGVPGDAASLAEPLARLKAEFLRRGRRPRFEFVGAVYPTLAGALEASGFEIEARPQLMVATPDTLRHVAPVPGLAVDVLDCDSPLDSFRAFIGVQRRAFALGDSGAVSDEDARWLREGLGAGLCFVARENSGPVGVSMFLDPQDALTELVGICTLESHRRRGIGGFLTHVALREAFSRGVTVAFLSAADARAGRLYEAAGFAAFGNTVFAIDPGP